MWFREFWNKSLFGNHNCVKQCFPLTLFFHRLRDHIELHVVSCDRYYLNSSDYCEGHTENSLRLKPHLH